MELSDRLEKFGKLVSNEPSNFLSKLEYYRTNKKWLDKSAMVAVNVLEALKTKGLSQKDLAQKMNVSAQQVNKILKGQQNLTFETISKLETALEISLIEIIDFKAANTTFGISNTEERVNPTLRQMKKVMPKVKKQVEVYERNIALGLDQKKPKTASQFKNS